MSSIDGVGGPKGPGGRGRVDPAEKAEAPKGAEERFRVDEPEAAGAAQAPEEVGDPAVTEAIEHAAGELRAGRLPDVRAAFDAVVRELVDTRYPRMAVGQRQQFARHLQEVLADDPVLGARITAELERAARE